MPASLTNTNVNETFKGLIHSGGDAIPPVGIVPLYDGAGNQTPINIGRSGNGIQIQDLSANNVSINGIKYPTRNGDQFNIVFQSNDPANNTPILELDSIPNILQRANIGLSYNSYTTNRTSSKISFYNVVNGLVRDVAEKDITDISQRAGGLEKPFESILTPGTFIEDLSIKGGLVTGVRYGQMPAGNVTLPPGGSLPPEPGSNQPGNNQPQTTRTQVRTFFFDLRLDADTVIEKTSNAGKIYDRRAVDSYVNYVWNLSHSTPPINGDIAIVIATKTREVSKAIPSGNNVVRTIKVTEVGMKSWGYRWSQTDWVFLGSREFEPGNNPAELTWIDPNYPCEDDVCYTPSQLWPLA